MICKKLSYSIIRVSMYFQPINRESENNMALKKLNLMLIKIYLAYYCYASYLQYHDYSFLLEQIVTECFN